MIVMGQNHITITPETPLPTPVSGHYTAWKDGQHWTWGGCNYPEIPCADGGAKHYYPQAYGASIEIDNGVLLLGGQDQQGSLTTCRYIPPKATNGGQPQDLTPLPIPLDNFAATYYQGEIYIAGGQSNGQPNQLVY